jgi:arylsulfatase A-like enzyme
MSHFGRLLVLLALIPIACTQSEDAPSVEMADVSASGPNVILITIDTLRADRLTVYGAKRANTPTLDRLAREGTLFESAISPMQMTRPSHYSILTSLYPRDHGVVNNKISLEPGFLTLTEVFRNAGYQTAAFVSVSLLGENSGAEKAFDHFVPPDERRVRSADEVIPDVLRWFDRSSRDKPFFLWVHLFDPHIPYAPPPDFAPESANPEFADLRKATKEVLIAIGQKHGGDLPRTAFDRIVDLYQGDINFTDHWLGMLIDKLRREETLDEAIVALTADHGECFENGIYFEHADCLYEGAARVPLIIRHPPVVPSGARRPEVVELLDVAPTLLSLASIPVPKDFLGRDLFEPSDEPRGSAFLQHPFYSNIGVHNRQLLRLDSVAGDPVKNLLIAEEQIGIRTADWKYLATGERVELYDLKNDPGEVRNLASERPEIAAALQERLDTWSAKHPQYRADMGQINDEMRATLKALGYVY